MARNGARVNPTSEELMKHPMQPIEADEHGSLRFKPNAIVRFFVQNGSLDMDDFAIFVIDQLATTDTAVGTDRS